MIVEAGSTDVTTYVVLRDVADGTATTGATITSIDLQYVRSGSTPSTKVDATALAATDTAHTDNYAIEIDSTDQPGLYRVDWPDAAFASGVNEVILTVKLADSFTEHIRVTLDTIEAKVDTVDTVVDSILVDTAEIGAAGAGLTDIGGFSTTAKAEINTECDTALTDYDPPTSAELEARTILAASYFDPTTDTVANVTTVGTCTTNTDMRGTDSAATAANLATLDSKVDTVDGIVDNILLDTAEIGTAGAGLTDLGGMSTAMKAEVNAEADTALSDYDAPTKAELDSGLAALNDVSSADVNAACDTALSDYGANTTTPPTAAAVADAVWDEDTADHQIAGTFGPVNDSEAGGGSAPTVTEIRQEMDSNSTQLAAIVEDTGTTIPSSISALNDVSSADVNAACDTALSDYDAPTKAEMDAKIDGLNDVSTAEVRTEVDDAISTMNDLSAAEVNAEVDTALADYDGPTKAELDSGLAALDIKIDTIDSIVDAIQTETDKIDATLPDSVPADGSIPTFRQAAYMTVQFLMERATSGTTVTVKKADGSTSLLTLTLDDATAPTSITRTT